MHENLPYGGAKRWQSGVQGRSPGKLKTCRAELGERSEPLRVATGCKLVFVSMWDERWGQHVKWKTLLYKTSDITSGSDVGTVWQIEFQRDNDDFFFFTILTHNSRFLSRYFCLRKLSRERGGRRQNTKICRLVGCADVLIGHSIW